MVWEEYLNTNKKKKPEQNKRGYYKSSLKVKRAS